MLNEGLKAGDLDGIIEKQFSVDQYQSKMGEDTDVCVLSFVCTTQAGAKDLESFAEKGYKNVLDADATPGTMIDGKYRVFVEFSRDEKLAMSIKEFLIDLKKLTNLESFQYTYHKGSMPVDAIDENLNAIPYSAETYTQKIQNLRIGETKKFFDNFQMMEMKLNDNIMTIKKDGQQQSLAFEIHNFGSTDAIIKETKAFAIDQKSIAETMHLTKFFGPYDITKTNENKFIFSKDGESAVVSKYKW